MRKLLLISICLTSFLLIKAQVPNDDCSTAIDMGTLVGTWSGISCYNGVAGFMAVSSGNSANATPSIPYYSMTGCIGYASATTTLADDVWYKFKSPGNGIKLYVPATDTVHINLYYGNSCNNLQPSGCWTQNGMASEMEFFATNDTSIYNYIQLSGKSPGDSLIYGVCIKLLPNVISYFGTININNNTNIVNNLVKFFDFNIIPNPSTGEFTLQFNSLEKIQSIEIMDVMGRKVYNKRIVSFNSNYKISLPDEVSNGIYTCVIRTEDQIISRKLVINK